jgi:hypothetical protein
MMVLASSYLSKIVAIFVLLITLGCGRPNIDEKLLGEWENTMEKYTPIKLDFGVDSLVTNTIFGRTVSTWKIEQNKIKFNILKAPNSSFEKEVTYEYKLNRGEDTLTIMVLNKSLIQVVKFTKVNLKK